MKAYRFLTGADDASFCHRVTEALSKGWELYGSPVYTYDKKNKAMRCGQVVVKTNDTIDYHPDLKLADV
jgi:hypothetical protein